MITAERQDTSRLVALDEESRVLGYNQTNDPKRFLRELGGSRLRHQVRIYDALGNNPTQAAIPLRNQLLISSQAYDQAQAEQLNADPNAPAANTNTAAPSTLPDPSTLVSFNPIVMLNWSSPDILNFETAYVKRMKNEADSATSFVRWHRLILTPQAATN